MIEKIFVLAALMAMPAAGQTAPITVYYSYDLPGANRWMADTAMRTALDRAEFLTAARRDAQVLEITVEGKVVRDTGERSTGFSFTIGFYRAGQRLGEASEYCSSDKAAGCAEQIAADIISASSIRR